MDFDPPIDEAQALSYNDGNTDEGTVIRVDKRNLTPINDPNCQHDWYHDAEDEDNAWAKVFKCRNCPRGFLESK